jgi:hypothetical protein
MEADLAVVTLPGRSSNLKDVLASDVNLVWLSHGLSAKVMALAAMEKAVKKQAAARLTRIIVTTPKFLPHW